MAFFSTGNREKACATLCFFLLASFSFSQRFTGYNNSFTEPAVVVEIGGSVGGMNCLTDLGGGTGPGTKFIKDINWRNTQLCGSLYAGGTLNDVLGLRLEATFGRVKAYDSILSSKKEDSHGRYYRNLHFQSGITEFAVVAEFHPLMLRKSDDKPLPQLSPYVLAGIARFSFNPQAYYKGQWTDLEPLRLEGQGFAEYEDRKPYRLSATSYPVGLGLRYEAGPLFYARLEAIYRITNTDYLDDVSHERYIDPAAFARNLTPVKARMATQLYSRSHELGLAPPDENSSRGYSTNNDSYFSCSLKIGLVINRRRL